MARVGQRGSDQSLHVADRKHSRVEPVFASPLGGKALFLFRGFV
jgi:hypothetical protein